MRRSHLFVPALLSLLSLAACSVDEGLSPVPSGQGGEGGSGAVATTGAGGEGGTVDPPLPPSEPVPLAVPEWLVAKVGSGADEIYDALEQKTFTMPAAGSYLGHTWSAVTPGEMGELIHTNSPLFYAAAMISVPKDAHVFARGDTVYEFYVNNEARQPGDFYHSRRMRVPLALDEGENLVVVRALGQRNTPEVELWSTTSEIVLNPDDLTAPDLVAGSAIDEPLGMPVLNLTKKALRDVKAKVIVSEAFEATELVIPSLAPQAATQVSFLLRPKAPFASGGEEVTIQLQIESPDLAWKYDEAITLVTLDAGSRYKRSRLSSADGSTQYYAVMPPKAVDAGQNYGLILSLHGAGVDAPGQAASYAPKDWAYLIAPTNRRPYGFDWEEWGRLDAIEALDDATAAYPIDPERVHLTGHSMGGHGTWNVGVHFPGRFGVIAPSAGWISFETYTGPAHATGPIGRARNGSQTLDYVENFAPRSVYIIHGKKDDNVPVSHAQTMYDTLLGIVPDLSYYEDPNGRHWWDNDPKEGADCVDWDPMIALMEATHRDPLPLDFHEKTPGPWLNAKHSFVTIGSADDPMADCAVTSAFGGSSVAITTDNVRSMVLDGAALSQKGVVSAVVDGTTYPVTSGPIAIGPQDGKTEAVSGPLNQVFQKPFCFVYEDEGPRVYRDYAAYLLSWWQVIGNGHGCGLPLSAVTDGVRSARNLIYLGVAREDLPGGESMPFSWDGSGVTGNGNLFGDAALAFVFPEGERLSAAFFATPGSEYLLFRYMPFSSRAGMPDFLIWTAEGAQATGFFDPTWALDPAFASGL